MEVTSVRDEGNEYFFQLMKNVSDDAVVRTTICQMYVKSGLKTIRQYPKLSNANDSQHWSPGDCNLTPFKYVLVTHYSESLRANEISCYLILNNNLEYECSKRHVPSTISFEF